MLGRGQQSFAKRVNQPSRTTPRPHPVKKPKRTPGESRYVQPENPEEWTTFRQWVYRRTLRTGGQSIGGGDLERRYGRLSTRAYAHNVKARAEAARQKRGEIILGADNFSNELAKMNGDANKTRRSQRGAEDIGKMKYSLRKSGGKKSKNSTGQIEEKGHSQGFCSNDAPVMSSRPDASEPHVDVEPRLRNSNTEEARETVELGGKEEDWELL
jgi:hypothetical protein